MVFGPCELCLFGSNDERSPPAAVNRDDGAKHEGGGTDDEHRKCPVYPHWSVQYFFKKQEEANGTADEHDATDEQSAQVPDIVLYEMGMKEKEHEVYFQKGLQNNRLLPLFEKIFGWGNKSSFNDVDLATKSPVEESKGYCKHRK